MTQRLAFPCFSLTSRCARPAPLGWPLQWQDSQWDEYILALQRAAYERALALVEERRPVIEAVGAELCENRCGGRPVCGGGAGVQACAGSERGKSGASGGAGGAGAKRTLQHLA